MTRRRRWQHSREGGRESDGTCRATCPVSAGHGNSHRSTARIAAPRASRCVCMRAGQRRVAKRKRKALFAAYKQDYARYGRRCIRVRSEPREPRPHPSPHRHRGEAGAAARQKTGRHTSLLTHVTSDDTHTLCSVATAPNRNSPHADHVTTLSLRLSLYRLSARLQIKRKAEPYSKLWWRGRPGRARYYSCKSNTSCALSCNSSTRSDPRVGRNRGLKILSMSIKQGPFRGIGEHET
eukprot:6506772-Prymnesium_polylepis.1